MANARRKALGAGPYLTSALFCERVLEETDGTLTLIRLVDSLTVAPPAAGPFPPDAYTRLSLVLAFRTDEGHGSHTSRVDCVFPSGERRTGEERSVTFLEAGKGVNLIGDATVPLSEAGLYRYEVFLNGERAASIPLRIEHAPSKPEAEAKPPSPAKTPRKRR